MTQNRILIVEDTLSLAMLFKSQLESEGYGVDLADTGAKAYDLMEKTDYQLLLLDLGLPDIDGFEILKKLDTRGEANKAIITTADGSLKRVIEAMQIGASDYLVKPFSEARMITTVRNTLEKNQLTQTIKRIEKVLPKKNSQDFVGDSLPMRALYSVIDNVAASKASIFITGESGTGKEVTAQAIHKAGLGGKRPFVALNCGAIPRDLFESELFGHKKGSFTGAIADYAGAAKRADGGTLFLDEICEMELDLQTKLLRFLQTQTIQPVGAGGVEKVDVRVICATNRDPWKEVEEGRFREDLYFRLNVVPISLAPLRERAGDVLVLAKHFLDRYGAEEGKEFDGFSVEAEQVLMARPWRGNVRELQNTIRQIAVMCPGGMVDLHHIPPEMVKRSSPGNPALAIQPATTEVSVNTLATASIGSKSSFLLEEGSLFDIEKYVINRRIEREGSVPKAAQSLGVSPSTIYRKKENWGD